MPTVRKFCTIHPTIQLLSVFPEEPPTECMVCIHLESEEYEARRNRPLWWDDASYIRYQSEDPFGDALDDMDMQAKRDVATIHTVDYCSGSAFVPHASNCPNVPTEIDVPF